MNRTRYLSILAAGLAALALSACGGMGGKSSQLYVLNPPTDVKTNAAANMNARLAITIPDAPAYLDTTRIALSHSATTTDYFASADWTDRVPVLVQNALVKSFEGSGKLKAVFRDTGMFTAEYQLQTELRSFEAQYAGSKGPPSVVVRLAIKLIKQPDRDIVGSHVAEKTVQADQNNLNSIVGAFNAALGAILQQTVDWTLRTIPVKPAKPVHKRKRAKAAKPATENQPAPETPSQ